MASDEIKRITHEADPERCQATIRGKGQCINKGLAKPDGDGVFDYCIAHGGHKQRQSDNNQRIRNYALTVWKADLEKKVKSPDIKSLRDEIGILRVLLENRLNQCQSPTDLILQSGPISDLVTKIERTVASCHKLEGSMGQLLDKAVILQFSGEVIKLIGQVVTNEDQLDTISAGMLDIINRMDDGEFGE